MKKLYIAIDVGCHECRVGSEALGAFWTKGEAEAACTTRSARDSGWRDGGQSIPEVFELDLPEGS